MPIINVTELEALKPNQSICAEVLVNIETDIGPGPKRRLRWETAWQMYLDPPKLTVIYPAGGQDKIVEGGDSEID